jgi:outer membrane protein
MKFPEAFVSLIIAIVSTQACFAAAPVSSASREEKLSSLSARSAYAVRCFDPLSLLQLDFLGALGASICASVDIPRSNALVGEQRANRLKSIAPYLPRIDFDSAVNKFQKSVNYKDFPSARYDLRGRNSDLNLSLNWLLYDFGVRSANREGALHMLNAAIADREYSVRKLINSTADVYFNAQAARDTLAAAKEFEEIAKESADTAAALVKRGAQSISDELLSQESYDQAVMRRIDAESERNVAFADLATLLGLPRNTHITVAASDEVAESRVSPDQALLTQLVESNPRVRYYSEQVLAAQSRLEATRAETRPTVSLIADTYRSLTPPDKSAVAQTINGWSVGIQVKIPIFDGFSHYANVQATAAQLEQKQMDLEAAKRDVETEIWNSGEALRKNHDKLAVAKRLVERARLAHEAAMLRYKNGIGSILELLKSQSDFSESEQSYIKVRAEWEIAKVKFATNLVTSDFNRPVVDMPPARFSTPTY